MDRMMPIDLERVVLRKRIGGFDQNQVLDLLNQVAQEWETLHRELRSAGDENARLKTAVHDYQAREDTLRDALLLAQRVADETRLQARKEADAILSDARRKAADDLHELCLATDRLREERERFEASFRNLLEGHLRSLRSHSLEVVDGELLEAI